MHSIVLSVCGRQFIYSFVEIILLAKLINLYSVNLDVFLQVGQGIVLVSMFGMFLTIRMQLQFGHFIFSVSGTIVFVFIFDY